MGKILVLAEKPSVGKELARVLGCKQSKDGHIVGNKYIVTWALGHLVTLADPEHYGDKYKTWALETLPMLPQKMDLVVIKETAKQFKVVRSLLQSNEVSELVIATDAGREGELVARWIIAKAGFKKPIKRLWISSQTDKAILDGFAHLRPAKEYDFLYRSAQCRAEADWLVGLNVTRALTCKYNAQLSAGRVQTPTLSMIVAREEEIKKFVPKEYYTVTLSANGMVMTWQDKNNQTRIFDKATAEALVAKLKNADGKITEVKKTAKAEQPPLLYDLTELQRDANKKYGYSAKKTLNIMQALYERHKLLTYPRTDSRYLTQDIVPTLTERLKCISISQYASTARTILRSSIRPNKRFVDNSKVTDHHAIIPTEQYVDLSSLSSEEKAIYDLVVRRFLAVLSPNFEYEQTSVVLTACDERFTAKGKIIKTLGWKSVYDKSFEDDNQDAEEKDQALPMIKQGDVLKLNNIKYNTGKTKPPARYTEATLLSAMEHPGKFIEDDRMRELMDNTSGLGTPATRADIIEKLFSSNYVEPHGKEICPTSKGMQVIELAPAELKSPELTAKWEQELNRISKGQGNGVSFINEIKDYTKKQVGSIIASTQTYRHDNLTRTKCPNCGKYLLEVNGKKGKMLVCQDRECGYRQNLSYLSNARCPNCHKKLEVFGDGEKRIYTCPCGFREKFDRFNAQLAEKKSQMNKKELAKYMREQKQEQPLNNALAEALKNIKL